jgi:hypothetical protein
MSKVYLFNGGGFVTAQDAAEFVTKMHSSSMFGRADSDAQFMQDVAARCHVDSLAHIRTYSADVFLHDLMANEYVIAINQN